MNVQIANIHQEKRVEMNPSGPLEEVIQLAIQGLSMKHEALDLSGGNLECF